MQKILFSLLFSLLIVPMTQAELTEAELDRRIEALRKRDFVIQIQSESGEPYAGEVSYELTRHGFEFGTALAASMLGAEGVHFGSNAEEITDADRETYQRIARELFSAAVMENIMKWSTMEGPGGVERPERVAAAEHAVAWCMEAGLKLRGHCLVWGVPRWLPGWQKELAKGDPKLIEEAIRGRMKRALERFQGRVTEWDLVNEMMHADIFREGLGRENGAFYFDWVREIDPDIKLYVNEYGVLQGDEVDDYVAHIRELLAAGVKVDGIGDQAHFFKPMPSSEHLWGILDKLGQFGLPVKITEFDYQHEEVDEEQRAKDLVRFYKVCFAHPAVEGIYMWGFWDGRHWRKNAGLWDRDWNPKPAAEAYRNLIQREWHTEGTVKVTDGRLSFRGFPGDYVLRVDGEEHRLRLEEEGTEVRLMIGGGMYD
ncbi:MAG: endo-1,4-beta-xylanase [Opitutales bacterium]